MCLTFAAPRIHARGTPRTWVTIENADGNHWPGTALLPQPPVFMLNRHSKAIIRDIIWSDPPRRREQGLCAGTGVTKPAFNGGISGWQHLVLAKRSYRADRDTASRDLRAGLKPQWGSNHERS